MRNLRVPDPHATWTEDDGRAALEAALPAERERVVLTGADEPIAIGWGWERGITRFQGRVIEQLLSPP